MKTIWNLTDFSELQSPVLTPYEQESIPKKFPRAKRVSRISVAFAMASAAFALTITGVKANSVEFYSPIPAVAYAQSGEEQKAPLDYLFSLTSDESWTSVIEENLLANLELRRKELSGDELRKQAIGSIFQNQQEDPFAEKLSIEEVARIVKQRKLL